MATPPVLRVGFVAARGLLAMDFNGFSDPFVQLLLLDHKGELVPGAPVVKTSIKTKTLSPEWNESVVIGDSGIDLRVVTTLRFILYDFDGFKKDDTLGVVDVPVDMALQLAEQGSDEWLQVRKLEGQMSKDATGELRLTFERVLPGQKKANDEEKGDAVVDDGSPNLLFVTIDSGRDLLPMDKNQKSDPMVKVSLTGQKYTTSTIEKTLKPHWDERFAFLVRDINTTLDLLVEDEDRTVNDFLGRAQIVLADVVEPDTEKKLDIKLLDKKLLPDKDRGSLHIRLLWVYDEDAETIAKSFKKKQRKTQSIFHQLTSHFHLTVPDVQEDEEEDIIAKLNDAEGILEDLSDDDEARQDSLPLPPDAKLIRFAAISIHRAEELPPLDALHFEKEQHKPIAPGGGIDAYVAGWIKDRPEEFVRTRIHTRKGRRDELSTSFHETLLLALPPKDDAKPTNITLAIMDWDHIGGDEIVSHIDLENIDALAERQGGKPFWWNLYGGPLVNVQNKEALQRENEGPDVGSTYRGRLLISLKVVEKPSTTYDERHQKRSTSKLPKEHFPPSSVYRLRAHFLSAIGLPEPTGKYYVSLSCGMHEITSTQKAAVNRSVEWNETEESDRLLFPDDATQIPDVILSLCMGEWEKRVVVSYTRFPAAQLLTNEFKDTTVEWVPLKAEPTTEAVKKNEFPGKVLLCLGFGPVASASAQVWDQRAMTDVVNRRVPYQIRVRVHGLKDVAKADGAVTTRKAPVHLRVQCADKEIVAPHVVLDEEKAPTVFSLDVNLPQLPYASQVLIHVKEDTEKDPAFIGTLAVSLEEAKDVSGVDASAIVTRCTSAQLKNNTRPQEPQHKWLPLLALDDSIESTQLLASVEIIRKMFPDEKLPAPEAGVAATP